MEPKGLNESGTTFGNIVGLFLEMISLVIPIVAGLAFLAFLWGVAKFIMNLGGDAKGLEEGKSLMKWGILALFVMVSVWGIIRFIHSEVGFGGSTVIPLLPY